MLCQFTFLFYSRFRAPVPETHQQVDWAFSETGEEKEEVSLSLKA